METFKASNVNWKHIVFCVIILFVFVLTIGGHINAESANDEQIAEADSSDIVPLQPGNRIIPLLGIYENEVKLAGPKEEVTVKFSEFDNYITTYADEIKFFSKTFGVNEEDILNDLRTRYENHNEELVENNIGYLLNREGNVKTFDSVEYGLVEYFYDFIGKHPDKTSRKRVPYSGDAKYIENLIIYYTTHIYTNVDTTTALSIGAAESGYYKVKYMLKANNVYGGMGSNGLIKHKNIEYGVLSYIRMLSKRYYGKGLNTPESIGRVYCPTYDNNGNRIASPHWKNLVSTASNKYNKYNYDVFIGDLLDVNRNA